MSAVLTKPITTRLATENDVPQLVSMWKQFVASSQYQRYVGIDDTHCTAAIVQMVNAPNCAVFVVGDEPIVGMLGVMVFEQPFSGETVATESFWWLDPQHRGHGGWLLKRAERWARERGAIRMSMMAPCDKPRVGAIYSALGYTDVEHVYQKDL